MKVSDVSLGKTDRIAVVGGGIIGLSIGWRLARRGCDVAVYDKGEAGREASWAAAGMLAPHSEVGFEEESFLHLGIEGLRRFPNFLRDLADDSGKTIKLDDRGTMIVGFHRDDTERIRRLFDFRLTLGLPVQWLNGSEARELEPLLSPKVTGAISLPDDGQVNNRDVVTALREAITKAGGRLREHTPVESVQIDGGRITGVKTPEGVDPFDAVVIAAGCWSNLIGGIATESRPPVRPVKGQVVALRLSDDCPLARVVRAPDVYLLPKDDGRLLVGATQEEMGFDTTPTGGGVMRLLEHGWEAIPSIYDLELESIDVGLRPGSRDHQPIIGRGPVEGLYYATGHHRHGVLLAPITADLLVDVMLEDRTNELIEPFAPSRFWKAQVKQ